MAILINGCLLCLLIIIIMQDFKYRLISWPLIPLLLVCFITNGLRFIHANDLLRYTLLNCGFVFLQLLLFTIYISVKNNRITNIINTYIGIGDILFFIAITSAFSPINFIVFYITGLLFALGFSLLKLQFIKESQKEIPLAGMVSIALIPVVITNYWQLFPNYYNDNLIVDWMTVSIL